MATAHDGRCHGPWTADRAAGVMDGPWTAAHRIRVRHVHGSRGIFLQLLSANAVEHRSQRRSASEDELDMAVGGEFVPLVTLRPGPPPLLAYGGGECEYLHVVRLTRDAYLHLHLQSSACASEHSAQLCWEEDC